MDISISQDNIISKKVPNKVKSCHVILSNLCFSIMHQLTIASLFAKSIPMGFFCLDKLPAFTSAPEFLLEGSANCLVSSSPAKIKTKYIRVETCRG